MLNEHRLLAALAILLLLAGCGEPTEPDTEPPDVEVGYPVHGLDVFGVVEIQAVVRDSSWVDSVKFYIDGDTVPDGVVTDSPYVYLWDTTVLPESTSHTISATAWDEPGNPGFSDTISVIVVPSIIYQIVSTHPTPVYASNLWLEGNLAYVADYGGGLQIVNVSDPANPFAVGTWDSLRYFWDVVVEGAYAFVAEEDEGILILDVSNPANPSLVGRCELSHGGRALSVSGNRVYMADVEENLQIFDVTDPSSPTLAVTFPLYQQAYDLWVSGNLAYVVVGDSIGLKVLDISGGVPDSMGQLATPNQTRGIYVEGNLGYLADGGYGGLQVADLSNPAQPEIIGSCATVGYAYSVWVSGRYAYVADGAGGLVVADLTRPEYPSRVAHVDTPGFAHGISVLGDYAYIADGNNGIVIVGWSR